jgi:hypothetical protein
MTDTNKNLTVQVRNRRRRHSRLGPAVPLQLAALAALCRRSSSALPEQ